MTYKQSLNILNFQLGRFDGDGEFDIPKIEPFGSGEMLDVPAFVGFGEKCDSPNEYGCHFFLDDYRFQRVWNSPIRYIEILRRYKYVLSPDFSMFTDYPKALSLYNHYRKHWCARFWQENGIDVIPVVNWIYEDSYSWCFDGEPHESIVAVSTTGINNNKAMIEMFANGYEAMEKALNPKQVLWFGKYVFDKPKPNVTFAITTFEDRITMLRQKHGKEKRNGTR